MIIQSKRVWIAGQFMEAQLEVEAGRILAIHPYGTFPADTDYGNNRILPGFIDVHTHGAYGFDTNDAVPEGLREWMRRIPEEGVTSILPTTVTQMPDVLTKALRMWLPSYGRDMKERKFWAFILKGLIWIWNIRGRSLRKP